MEINNAYKNQAKANNQSDQIDKIDYVCSHLSQSYCDSQSQASDISNELTILNIFVVLKVRRHIPTQYTHELKSVLALY